MFITALQSSPFAARVKPYPLFAEDFVCLRQATYSGSDWISAMTAYYAANFAGVWNATAIGAVMAQRRAGDYYVSVGSLCGAQCAWYNNT